MCYSTLQEDTVEHKKPHGEAILANLTLFPASGLRLDPVVPTAPLSPSPETRSHLELTKSITSYILSTFCPPFRTLSDYCFRKHEHMSVLHVRHILSQVGPTANPRRPQGSDSRHHCFIMWHRQSNLTWSILAFPSNDMEPKQQQRVCQTVPCGRFKSTLAVFFQQSAICPRSAAPPSRSSNGQASESAVQPRSCRIVLSGKGSAQRFSPARALLRASGIERGGSGTR